MQLVLIGRIRPIERLYGFDKQNILHRSLGYSLALFLLVHPLLLTIGYSGANELSLTSQFLDFLFHWQDVSRALVGLLLMIGLIFVSLPIIRKRIRYDRWHFVHLLMYAAVALIFIHQTKSGDVARGAAFYYWYVLNFTIFGLVLLYRFVRPFYLFARHRFYVDKVVPETINAVSIYIKGKNLERFQFAAGQYANFIFLQKKMLQSHQFSFSAAPNGEFLRITIKAVGDFTSQIRNLKSGTMVIIDGPLGAFTEAMARRDKFLFIAGGIGITPIRSLIESLSAKKKDVVLLYANKVPEEIALRKELEFMSVKQTLIISEKPEGSYECGRVDAEKIVRLVPDYLEREIFICGPPPMMKSIVQLLRGLGADPSAIHFEKFSY